MDLVKTNCINDVVIIDGLSRSGKFYLGKLIACIEGMEYFINSAEFERILALNIAGTLSDANASSILVIAINEAIYNMAIGRNLNMREEDSSSILNSFESELYLNRVGNSNVGSNALKKVVDQGRLSVFITHMALMSLDMVKKAVPKSKIINIRRHPIDLAYSWIKRGWGSRYEEDPLSFDPIYCSDIGIVPYFAVGWAEEYLVVNEHDRVVKSIVF